MIVFVIISRNNLKRNKLINQIIKRQQILVEKKKKIEELHANFFEELYEKKANIVSCAQKKKEYCSENNRILIREPAYPLEIEKVANNLKDYTIRSKEKRTKNKQFCLKRSLTIYPLE